MAARRNFLTRIGGVFSRLFGAVKSRRRVPAFCVDEARRCFRWQREHLEARFVDLAQAGANPTTPRWDDCEFADEVMFVRNRRTGQLSAFVSIIVMLAGRRSVCDNPGSLTAGSIFSEQPTAPSVRSLRSATAIFSFDGERWTTDATTIFNLSPTETIHYYRHDLEVVSEGLPADQQRV